MNVATTLLGTREYPGASNNPAIMRWAARTARFLGVRYDGDAVPWCGLFVCYSLVEAGFVPASIAVRASAWAAWGVPLQRGAYGAVLVFTRQGGGHVGFYVGEDANHYHVLGGNQGDAVNVMRLAKDRLTAIRWPCGYGMPAGGPIVRRFAGPTSVNER